MTGGELTRRTVGVPLPRTMQRENSNTMHATSNQVNRLRATVTVTQQAMFDVTELKNLQRELELSNPAASEFLNLIYTTAAMSIARSVARFGAEMGG